MKWNTLKYSIGVLLIVAFDLHCLQKTSYMPAYWMRKRAQIVWNTWFFVAKHVYVFQTYSALNDTLKTTMKAHCWIHRKRPWRFEGKAVCNFLSRLVCLLCSVLRCGRFCCGAVQIFLLAYLRYHCHSLLRKLAKKLNITWTNLNFNSEFQWHERRLFRRGKGVEEVQLAAFGSPTGRQRQLDLRFQVTRAPSR